MSLTTLREAIASRYIQVHENSILFLGGYYDGSWEIDHVESILAEHGYRRVVRLARAVSACGRVETSVRHPSEVPTPEVSGEFRLWPTFRMKIEELK